MKKLFAILAVTSVITACNNAAEEKTANPADDTLNQASDAQRVLDSITARKDTGAIKPADDNKILK